MLASSFATYQEVRFELFLQQRNKFKMKFLLKAYQSVEDGLSWAVVTVPFNFSVGVLDRTYNGMDATQISINESIIRVSFKYIAFNWMVKISDGSWPNILDTVRLIRSANLRAQKSPSS